MNKRMKSSGNQKRGMARVRFWLSVGIGFLMMSVSVTAAAAVSGGFGSIGNNVASASKGMSHGLYEIFLLTGLFLSGASVIGFAVAQKRQQPTGMYIGGFIAGVLLTSIVAFIGAGSTTVFQSNQSQLKSLNYQNGN